MKRPALFGLFFGICLGLAYPYLNRVAPGAGGLDDVVEYLKMTRGESREVEAPFRYRPLLPAAARTLLPVLDRLPTGSWHREMLALVLVNAVLTAAAALLIRQTAVALGDDESTATIAALFFLTSFAAVNVYVAGFVDSLEVAVVAACIRISTTGRRVWLIPLLALAATGKETAVAFGAVFALCMAGRRAWRIPALAAFGGLLTIVLVRWLQSGVVFGDDLWTYRNARTPLQRLIGVLTAKSLLYTFAVPLAVALPRLRTIPPAVRLGTAVAVVVALTGAALGGIGENVSRPLFNVCAPLLCIAAARTLGQQSA